MDIRSYSKPLALTHAHAAPLREVGEHLVYQEKVDGSQFSFRIDDGVLSFRSRRVVVRADDPGMFARAVEAIQERADKLVDGWTYRGEFLSKPHHNAITYARVPVGHVVLFDVDRGHCDYLPPLKLAKAAEAIGLESVPTWRCKGDPHPAWLEAESFLGGVIVEGYVVKDYARLGRDSKVMMGKVVRESFKEVHTLEWRKANPTRSDVIQQIITAHATEARWTKAVQHLREAGELVDAPQDIGALMREASRDIDEECAEAIKEWLWAYFRKPILRGATKGLPLWYKSLLAGE